MERLFFSPVRGLHVLEAAEDLILNAESAFFLSAPFGIGQGLVDAVEANSASILEYGLANSTAKRKIEALRHANTRFFTPSRLKRFRGENWDAKAFGAHKIHTKCLVVDPWSANPRVLFGSANFSKPSCQNNDENTFLVEGNARFAAVVATEFLAHVRPLQDPVLDQRGSQEQEEGAVLSERITDVERYLLPEESVQSEVQGSGGVFGARLTAERHRASRPSGKKLSVAGTFIYNGVSRFHTMRTLDVADEMFDFLHSLSVGQNGLQKAAIVLPEEAGAC